MAASSLYSECWRNYGLWGYGITNSWVVIYYNRIGAFNVRDRQKIRLSDMSMETRKGVALSYAPEEIVV